MIKAIFMDIDETLLNSKKEITERNKIAIKKCIENGIKIILTSGRSRKATLKLNEKAEASPYIISSNGADIYDIKNNKQIFIDSIPKESVEKLFQYAQENNYKINLNYNFELVMNKALFPDDKNYIKSENEIKEIINQQNIVQCVITNLEIEKMKEFKQYLKESDIQVKIENESKKLKDPKLAPCKYYYCDVTSLTVSKGNAVKKLCEYLNLNTDEIAVIGDGENDVSMFEITKNSVVMENALEHVKLKANQITDSNDNSGVAKFLETLI